MDYCPVCGGYLAGAQSCAACGNPVQPPHGQAQFASGPYPDQGYPAQDGGCPPRYDQPPGYDRRAAPRPHGAHADRPDYPAYPDHGAQGGYGGDPMVVWHLPQQYAAQEAGTATRPAPPPELTEILDPAELTGPAGYGDPDDGPLAEGDDLSAGATTTTAVPAADAEYGDDEQEYVPFDVEERGQRHGRRGKSKRRTMKLVLGTASGLVLAGALVTALPSGLVPTGQNSAPDSPPRAGGGTDSTGAPDAVPVSAPGSGAAAGGKDASASPSASASAKAKKKKPSASVAPTPPPAPVTTAPPPAPTTAPPQTHPAQPTQPTKHCVLLCW